MKSAVAIKYTEDLVAPVILAKGKGDLANKIIDIASKNKITIMEDSVLTDSLIELDIGSLIPEEFYEVIAKILIFVKEINE